MGLLILYFTEFCPVFIILFSPFVCICCVVSNVVNLQFTSFICVLQSLFLVNIFKNVNFSLYILLQLHPTNCAS